MKKKVTRSFLILLVLTTLLQASAFGASKFPDVDSGAWFANDVNTLAGYGLLNGYPDGTFKPNATLSRAEFITMVTNVAELWSDKAPTGKHWAESSWNALKDAGILDISTGYNSQGSLFPCTKAALDSAISRYEMTYIINGVLYSAFYEKKMELKDSADGYGNYISDYNTMDKSYQGPVEQVFSKGILMGYDDGSFVGGNSLTRAEAAATIVRLAWSNQRKAVSFAVEKEEPVYIPGSGSFAIKYRTMNNAERRTALFGNPNKTYFASPTEAKNYMVGVEVPIWKLGSGNIKVASKAWITVHKLVANEVKTIFNEIYSDVERFPINAVGGARYSDTMRHSWGAAIDINPTENYYIDFKTGATVGSFCYKNGSSPYCITPNGSVVRAFARQGWGWGGQGWSTAADYMHFSILATGG